MSDITKQDIFNIKTEADFRRVALAIFRKQSKECAPYAENISLLGIDPEAVSDICSIPFLPVRYFKSRDIITTSPTESVRDGVIEADKLDSMSVTEKVFTSSATTGMVPARHLVKDLSIYEESFLRSFSLFFAPPENHTILALLPSYIEREGSSLVYMADKLIALTGKEDSGFYLYNYEELYNTLIRLRDRNEPTILLGVSFALLDFVKRYKIKFPALTVMETGGMKGRGEEISREKLHTALKEGFGVEQIASEYGMAELLSQAYSHGEGIFRTPPWMKIFIRDINNPFRILSPQKSDNSDNIGILGGVNIIDLANINSCSFIETEDLGTKKSGEIFTLSGRISNSERRGCNMLIED